METTTSAPSMITPERPRVEWNLVKRVAFRFMFLESYTHQRDNVASGPFDGV